MASRDRNRSWVAVLTALAAAFAVLQFGAIAPACTGSVEVRLEGPLRYQVFAGAPQRNRRMMGPVVNTVQGVPAEPVDSFVWDGVGSDPIQGELLLEIDPVRNTGFVLARWTDEYGDWVFRQTRFIHPEHPSGVRLGSSVAGTEAQLNDGAAHNVYLHGDTTAGLPILPTVFAFLAAWGPADITLNGEPFENPFGIPAPQWLSHMMVTEGVRGPDGTVRNRLGGIYSPADGANGEVDPTDLEVHLVFHGFRARPAAPTCSRSSTTWSSRTS